MKTVNISGRIEKFIVDEIMMASNGTRLDPESSLINNGIVDSLSLLRLISFIEEEFGVRIEDEEVIPENFDSLTIMESLIAAKL